MEICNELEIGYVYWVLFDFDFVSFMVVMLYFDVLCDGFDFGMVLVWVDLFLFDFFFWMGGLQVQYVGVIEYLGVQFDQY